MLPIDTSNTLTHFAAFNTKTMRKRQRAEVRREQRKLTRALPNISDSVVGKLIMCRDTYRSVSEIHHVIRKKLNQLVQQAIRTQRQQDPSKALDAKKQLRNDLRIFVNAFKVLYNTTPTTTADHKTDREKYHFILSNLNYLRHGAQHCDDQSERADWLSTMTKSSEYLRRIKDQDRETVLSQFKLLRDSLRNLPQVKWPDWLLKHFVKSPTNTELYLQQYHTGPLITLSGDMITVGDRDDEDGYTVMT